MTKKRLKKVYKPMAYISIGCFLIYILLSQAMSVFSRTAEIDKLEKEVAIVKKEKNDLQNEEIFMFQMIIKHQKKDILF